MDAVVPRTGRLIPLLCIFTRNNRIPLPKKVLLGTRPDSLAPAITGISTQLRDYRLTFFLNRELAWNLARRDDFQGHSLYTFRDEEEMICWYLIANRNQEQWLLPAFRQTDYLLIPEGPVRIQRKEELVKAIRNIPGILLVTAIDLPVDKTAGTFLTELELHLSRISRPRPD